MSSIDRLLELAGIAKGPTIVSATERSGNVNRKTADRILDPKGYFEKNKQKNFHGKSVNEVQHGLREYLAMVEKHLA